MEKRELLNLMTFICDSTKTKLVEVVNTNKLNISSTELQAVINVLEADTKDKFLRIIANQEVTKTKSKVKLTKTKSKVS